MMVINPEDATHFFRCIGAAMQTKTMPILLGGKAMLKNSFQVFVRDSSPVVAYFDANVTISLHRANRQKDGFIRLVGFREGLLRVSNKVDEDLKYFAGRPELAARAETPEPA